jgi:hypothetical protein
VKFQRPSTATRLAQMASVLVALFAVAVLGAAPAQADTPAGTEWTQQTVPVAGNDWLTVTYGGGLFVTVAARGSSNQVMTSPDGVTWTASSVTGANDIYFRGITYGNGRFVAVGVQQFGPNQVMVSTDGVSWSLYGPADREWSSVAYGAGVFVAVSRTNLGVGSVMTSSDGATWTVAPAAQDNNWNSVVYAGGQFVAVAEDGANRVMTSPDGVTWTLRTAASASGWYSVTYGDGRYVATAWTGTDRVMTSPDGITWSAQSGFEAAQWPSVTFGDGLFVAVSFDASGDRVMTSPDGVTWTGRPAASAKQWMAVTYGNGTFVSVARFAGTSAVMTSSAIVDPVLPMAEWLVIHQALPMPASDTCADVTDSDVAWGTGLTGGWTRGWEPWVESGNPDAPRGGWACIRTLVNTGGNRWLIGGSA